MITVEVATTIQDMTTTTIHDITQIIVLISVVCFFSSDEIVINFYYDIN